LSREDVQGISRGRSSWGALAEGEEKEKLHPVTIILAQLRGAGKLFLLLLGPNRVLAM
jgi:hypothetical protein